MQPQRRSRGIPEVNSTGGWIPVILLALILPAACTRPLGVWKAPPDAAVPARQNPCAYMGGQDPEAPWPMTGRCPSRAGFIDVTGPTAPQVLWTTEVRTDETHGVVIDASETLYVPVADDALGPAVRAYDRRGAVLWTTATPGPVWRSPTLGRDGRLYVAVGGDDEPWQLLSLDRSTGSLVFALDLAESDLSFVYDYVRDFPVLASDGSIWLGNGWGFISVSPDGEEVRSVRGRHSGPVLLDETGRLVTSSLEGMSAGHGSSSVLRYGDDDTREVLADVDEALVGMVIVPAGNILLLATEDAPYGFVHLRSVSPLGYARWEHEPVGPATDCSLAADDLRRAHLVCDIYDDFESFISVSLIERIGTPVWETVLPGASRGGQIILDRDATTYLGGGDREHHPALWAIDAAGVARWSLPLTGERGTLLGMGGTGRLYVSTGSSILCVGDPDR